MQTVFVGSGGLHAGCEVRQQHYRGHLAIILSARMRAGGLAKNSDHCFVR